MYDLERLAKQVMEERGLKSEFSQEVYQQLARIQYPAKPSSGTKDLRSFLWCSIDNDDSRDLDQLTYAQKDSNNQWTLWVAVADVDSLVAKNTPIDAHAQYNTTSVYTPAKIFPMLPEKLSTLLTSLNEAADRMAIAVKLILNSSGEIEESSIFPAIVRNCAKLTYNSVGAWLKGAASVPEKVQRIKGLEKVLLLQHEVAQLLADKRRALGALTLQPSQIEAKVTENQQVLLALPERNFAHQIIENFMIAANQAMAEFFRKVKIPAFRRVVRIPKRWERIVEIAASYGSHLPQNPDSKALDQFLIKRQKEDPASFPDLSLTIIKLLGRGEYIIEIPSEKPVGHFGLGLTEYMHSTAPNRRFPDLIAQRQFKQYPEHKPYSVKELQHLATHCTEQEDAAMKVERRLNKSAAGVVLSSQIGRVFRGMITGAAEKGTWVRICDPFIEGKLVKGFENLDVGDKVEVKLLSVDIPKGYINFGR